MSARHGAVTIVSKNYFAFAQVLAESYRAHHPGHDFVIVLVDKAGGRVPATLPCGAEVVEIADFAIPDIGRFIYRYSIMELNTAVKPFVLADLFRRRDYATLLYLDPDILVLRPLEAIHAVLEKASIALIPHLRRPYFDESIPSDLTILQSGTYNLGFLGLRAGESAKRLLAWWMAKLYRDCVVDIPKGLFVDQKWIDLVPGLFPDHGIVHDAACNVAYWNLHDRRLAHENGQWTVDGKPLVFFHFSGYSPFAPGVLSKHQNRHQLEHDPALRALTDHYAALLMARGHEESSNWPYDFETLPNGVQVPLDIVRSVMQWAARESRPTPCPVTQPDEFCRFLMSRDVLPGSPNVVLLFHFLLRMRSDVLAAYPEAATDSDHAGFRAWIKASGVNEYRIAGLLEFENPSFIADCVADVFGRLRRAGRVDLLERHRAMWREAKAFEAFADWVATHGAKQLRFDRRHAQALRRAVPGVGRILNLYFLRGDLQVRFSALGDRATAAAFVGWLRQDAHLLGLDREEISLFEEYAIACPGTIEEMRFLYQHEGRASHAAASLFSIDERRREISSLVSSERILEFLHAEKAISPADHLLAVPAPAGGPKDDFARCSVPGLDARRNFEFVRRLREDLAARESGGPRVNLAGFFDAPSGMGESARSMRATLGGRPDFVREVTLPHPLGGSGTMPPGPVLFGWPFGGADVSISVANADSIALLKCFLPASSRGRRNVGFWVWETERLPLRFRDSAAWFDEIWTPSVYAAEAVRGTVDRPVRVLPHTLDFDAIGRAKSDRRRFGLPEEGTLFGFAFDPLSVLERKNVSGLIRAFQEAFRDDDGCHLVLKVNGRTQGLFDYEMLRASVDSSRVLFLEATLPRDDSLAFMKSLDAYVSLHRSEGFGLTCAEAMALGLPVIATAYSGNLDFMDDSNGLLVPASVVETDRAHGPYPPGSRWADPDLEAAASLMRTLRDRGRREDIGRRASASVRSRLDPAKIAAKAWSMIEDLSRSRPDGAPAPVAEAPARGRQ